MTQIVRVGIFGASGYAGQNLVEILSRHPHCDLVFATSNTYANEHVPGTELRYTPPDDAELDRVDAVFLALPHKTSATYAKKALEADLRVIDLSADLRLDSAETYKTWYDIDHPHPDLLPVPYGLPEMYRDDIAGAKVVAVPGCYPTSILLGLYPLLRVQALSLEAPIVVDAKSGVSGAGRAPSPKTHFVEVFGNLVPYKVGRAHRHVGEVEQEIQKFMQLSEPLIFSPHLIPVDRGLMSSIMVTLNYSLTSDRAYSLYANVYADEPLVRLIPQGDEATLRGVVLSNRCHISLTPITERYLHITSVIDNLRKGAASQAVQCFNLMYRFAETTALLED